MFTELKSGFKAGATLLPVVLILLLFSGLLYASDTLSFSFERGFYEGPFELEISSSLQDAEIHFTLDCTEPATSPTTVVVSSPYKLNINPNAAGRRYNTPCVVVRALVKSGSYVSPSVTHTYIFLENVKSQGYPGGIWPRISRNGQMMDYEIDSRVIDDPAYSDLIDAAFTDIPSVSLVTDAENLIDGIKGIYVNATQYGREWERPASVELIYPGSDEPGFQVNAGVRIRGGWSRHDENPKHAFRLFFRSDYGPAKLKYPMFGDEGVDEFDHLDLRTSQNDSWSFLGSEYNIMNRDVFSRDTQRDIGQPYTRSRYYHLYLNGMYWGLFQSQERSEADYAESYFGGNDEDYDVIKPYGGYQLNPYTNYATDGNMDAYRRLWETVSAGVTDNETYFKIQGMNPDGSINRSYERLIDVDNLIDYMLIIYFTGNNDAPVTRNGEAVNNYFAIYDRTNPDGFKYFLHDAEHTLVPYYYYHDVTVLTRTGRFFEDFNPRWLHQRLAANKEYLQRFIDRVYNYMYNDGVLTPRNNIERFESRVNEIDMAIIAESARWGDSKILRPRTKNDDWLPAINDLIHTYFPMRTNLTISQLRNMEWYPEIDPPRFFSGTVSFSPGIHFVNPGFKLSIINMNSTASEVYFTTDGSDPRLPGGNIDQSAENAGTNLNLDIDNSTNIKARVLSGNTWSALAEIILFTDSSNDLRITEINYHPLDEMGVNDTEFEFIELYNSGSHPLNLGDFQFTDGIEYNFGPDAFLHAGEFLVLASNINKFRSRYGFNPFGKYRGQLSNGGEKIAISNALGTEVLSVIYDDSNGWPTDCDGAGYSLVLANPALPSDWNNPESWRASNNINGSPGYSDSITDTNEQQSFPETYKLYNNYPNPFNNSTTISYYLPFQSVVHIDVYNLLGQKVFTLLNRTQEAGSHDVQWMNNLVSSGIYFYRFTAESLLNSKKYKASKKLVLLK